MLAAQDAGFITLLKSRNFVQGRAHIVGLADSDIFDPEDAPLTFEASVEAASPYALQGVTLDFPSPPGGSLALPDPDSPPQGRQRALHMGFEAMAAMDAAAPDGAYTFNVNGANDSPPVHVVPLDLFPDATGSYRGVSKFTAPVFQAARAIDPSQPFTFQWDTIPGGLASDFVWFSIVDDGGSDFYYSPDLGEPGALDGTSLSFTIPADTLSSGTRYEAILGVFHPIDTDLSYTAAVSAFGTMTSMEIRTTGMTDHEAPAFLRPVPSNFRTGIATDTIVTFVFSEAMDPAVDPAQAITWTGLPDPSLFAYRWSPDRTLLFCSFPPGLPVSSTIGWVLNPPGSAAKLRDAAGNIMDGSRSGNFQTSPTSSAGIPDVASLALFKAKAFFQTGAGLIDLGQYFAGFSLELSGISTVSSVDLGIPGVGLETGLGEFAENYRSIDGEASFADPGDMHRIFPAGNYTATLHTFHDGIRTVTLNLGSGGYPSAPTVQNFAATQAIDAGQDFVLQWDPWTGGTTGDYILVSVDGDSGITFFESPGFGQLTALDGTATSVTIPAASLPPGRVMEADIIFVKVIGLDTTQYAGVPVGSAYAAVTALELQTTGNPLNPQLEILSQTGSQVRLRLTGERGRYYQIQSGPALPVGNPVWFGRLVGNASGYRASFDYSDNNVSGVATRFYQASEVQGSPP